LAMALLARLYARISASLGGVENQELEFVCWNNKTPCLKAHFGFFL